MSKIVSTKVVNKRSYSTILHKSCSYVDGHVEFGQYLFPITATCNIISQIIENDMRSETFSCTGDYVWVAIKTITHQAVIRI